MIDGRARAIRRRPRHSSRRSPIRGTCSASGPTDPTRAVDPAEDRAAVRRRQNRIRFHRRDRDKKKKVKKKPGEPRPLPPPPPPLPGAPQVAGGHGSAPQIKVRATYADAYKPPDAPVRRPAPPLQDALRAARRARRQLPAEAFDRGDARLRHQSFARPERQGSGFTTVEPALKMQSDWSRHEFGLDLRGSYSRIRLAIVAEPSAGRSQELFAHRRLARHHDQHRKPLLPVDRLSGQPEPAGRLRQAADLRDLRQHASA